MPALATWLVGLIGNVVGYFGIQLTKKTLFATAAVAAFLLLTTAFIIAIKAMLLGIAVSMPDLASSAYYFIPTNTASCISLLFSARMARFIYDYNVQTLKIVASIN